MSEPPGGAQADACPVCKQVIDDGVFGHVNETRTCWECAVQWWERQTA